METVCTGTMGSCYTATISPVLSNISLVSQQGEYIMAEVDTQMLSNQHSDIRFEQQRQANDLSRQMGYDTNEIVKEGLKESFNARGDIKDSRHDVLREVDRQADRLDNQATQFYIAKQTFDAEAARDLATLKALTDANATAMRHEISLNVEKVGAATALQAEKIASASALGAEKIATAVALGQSILSKEIFADGQKTRDLINDLKYHDLNRALVERNTELVDERHGRRHWRYQADQNQYQGQWAALQNQLQAFQSQLQETRQGMVNFGTMAGVGQTSTSNNVR